MEDSDKFPEEVDGGVPATLRQRMANLLATAVACEEEARQHEVDVARLRTRADSLRNLALEYRGILVKAGHDPEGEVT